MIKKIKLALAVVAVGIFGLISSNALAGGPLWQRPLYMWSMDESFLFGGTATAVTEHIGAVRGNGTFVGHQSSIIGYWSINPIPDPIEGGKVCLTVMPQNPGRGVSIQTYCGPWLWDGTLTLTLTKNPLVTLVGSWLLP